MKLINKNNNIIFVVEKHIINKHGINFNMKKKENNNNNHKLSPISDDLNKTS